MRICSGDSKLGIKFSVMEQRFAQTSQKSKGNTIEQRFAQTSQKSKGNTTPLLMFLHLFMTFFNTHIFS